MAWRKTKEENPQEIIEEIKKPTSFKNTNNEKTMVVKELPLRPIRQYKDEDGTIINLITIEEALTEMMN